MSLLAFQDISKSPLADLVENSQRIKISSEVNYELLKSQSKEKGSIFFHFLFETKNFIIFIKKNQNFQL